MTERGMGEEVQEVSDRTGLRYKFQRRVPALRVLIALEATHYPQSSSD